MDKQLQIFGNDSCMHVSDIVSDKKITILSNIFLNLLCKRLWHSSTCIGQTVPDSGMAFLVAGNALVDLLQQVGEAPPEPNMRVLVRHPFQVNTPRCG